MSYGYSHNQNGPWAGRTLGGDDYFNTPAEALEGGRAMHYHAGQDNEEKGPVWVAKLESVEIADFLTEGLTLFLADMKEKAVVDFESGGEALEFWLSQYSPMDAYADGADPQNITVAFTRMFDMNFGRMLEYMADSQRFPIGKLTRVAKGDNDGYLKMAVEYNQAPRFQW